MRPILGCSAAALAVFVLVLPARAVTQTPTRAMTIRLLWKVTGYGVTVDLPPKRSASKGDVFWERGVLRNQVPQFGRPKNAVVGSDYTTFHLLSHDLALVQDWTTLPGGTIRAQGRETSKETSGTIAVVGGTGNFSGARGTAYIRNLDSSGAAALNVYRLRLP